MAAFERCPNDGKPAAGSAVGVCVATHWGTLSILSFWYAFASSVDVVEWERGPFRVETASDLFIW